MKSPCIKNTSSSYPLYDSHIVCVGFHYWNHAMKQCRFANRTRFEESLGGGECMHTVDEGSRHRNKRPLRISTLIAVLVWVIAIALTGFVLVNTSQQARNAAEGAVIDGKILGLHLFQGFKLNGFFGVHIQSGLLVMLLIAVVASAVVLILGKVFYSRRMPKSTNAEEQ